MSMWQKLAGSLVPVQGSGASSVTEVVISPGDFGALYGTPVLGTLSTAFDIAWLFDGASEEQIAAQTFVPMGWATLNVELWWTNAGAGSGNVRWDVRYDDVADGGSLAGHSADGVLDVAAPAQNVLKKSTLIAGHVCVPGELARILVFRDGDHGADTLANDAAVLAAVLRKAS